MNAKWQYKQAYEVALEHNHELEVENAKLKRAAERDADVLESLNLSLEESQAENAELRDELAKWERLTTGIELPEHPVTQFEPKDFERENAELRKLCADACAWMSRALYDGSARRCEYESITERMRELGIEVRQ